MGVLTGKPDFMTEAIGGLVAEAAAEVSVEAIAGLIHALCGPIAHRGSGEVPFDGAMSAIYAELLKREGWLTAELGEHTEVDIPVMVKRP